MGGGSQSDVAGLLRLKAKSKDAADLAYTTEDSAVGTLVLIGDLWPSGPRSLLERRRPGQVYKRAPYRRQLKVNGVAYSVPQAVDGTFAVLQQVARAGGAGKLDRRW
jgi:hypothetical protein